jgi:hypothetical protein
MSEDTNQATPTSTSPKAKKETTEVTIVTMPDGREASFVGKRKMNKDRVVLSDGSTAVRFDLRNGYTFNVSQSPLLSEFAAHGAAQKIGDEASGEDEIDDMQVAIDTIMNRLEAGEWGKQRGASDGFAGAGMVVRALCEVTKKSVEYIKAYLEKKLASDPKLTRRDLYASFKNPNSPTGQVILRMENEKRAKASAVDVQAELDLLSA